MSMNSIDTETKRKIIPEQKKISEWAQKNALNPPQWPSSKETNFVTYDNSDNVRGYGWNNLQDLHDQLGNMWGGKTERKALSFICAVAAYKERDIMQQRHSTTKVNSSSGKESYLGSEQCADEGIPDFIYVF